MTTAPRPLPIATTFCEAAVPLFDGLSFYVDGNSKITRGNGSYSSPKPNAFSLPAASVPDAYAHAGARACPGSTPTCRSSCYVRGLAQHAPALYAHYRDNEIALSQCLSTPRGFSWSALKLGMWIEDNAAEGFRWHVSGDVLSPAHAEWIVSVCKIAADVPFWIYTRTLLAVSILREASNLAVNVSADADNYASARAIALEHGARLCYLITGEIPADLPPGSVLFPDYPVRKQKGSDWFDALAPEHRKMICPADMFSQSEAHRCGPCTKCF
jgi:hypothetical protein